MTTLSPLFKLSELHCIVEPIDMRLGIDGLSTWIQQQLGQVPAIGSAFIFCNRPRNRLKVLIWDHNGVWLCMRRLHHGSFIWPSAQDHTFTLSSAQAHWLFQGIDWQRLTPQLASNRCL